MTAQELIDWLANKPRDAEVWYRDMNFGGRDQPAEFGVMGISFQNGDILIASQRFEDLD